MLFGSAARLMVWTRFKEMWRHRDDTIGGDVEALHDMRVGSRRLRAALEMAAPAFAGKEHRRFGQLTERLTERLGAVRDHDVLLHTLEEVGAQTGEEGALAAGELRRLIAAERLVERQRLLAFFEELGDRDYAEMAARLWRERG